MFPAASLLLKPQGQLLLELLRLGGLFGWRAHLIAPLVVLVPGDGELDAEGQVIQELQQREALALILGGGLELLFELLPELAEQRFLLPAGLQPHHQVQAWLQLLVQHRGHDAHVDVAVPDFLEGSPY